MSQPKQEDASLDLLALFKEQRRLDGLRTALLQIKTQSRSSDDAARLIQGWVNQNLPIVVALRDALTCGRYDFEDLPAAFAVAIAKTTGDLKEAVQSEKWRQHLLNALSSVEFNVRHSTPASRIVTVPSTPEVEMGDDTAAALPSPVQEVDMGDATIPVTPVSAPAVTGKDAVEFAEKTSASVSIGRSVSASDRRIQKAVASAAETASETVKKTRKLSVSPARTSSTSSPKKRKLPVAAAGRASPSFTTGPSASVVVQHDQARDDDTSSEDTSQRKLVGAVTGRASPSFATGAAASDSVQRHLARDDASLKNDPLASYKGIFNSGKPNTGNSFQCQWSNLLTSFRYDSGRITEFTDQAEQAAEAIAEATEQIHAIQHSITEHSKKVQTLLVRLTEKNALVAKASRNMSIADAKRTMYSNFAMLEMTLKNTITTSLLEMHTQPELQDRVTAELVKYSQHVTLCHAWLLKWTEGPPITRAVLKYANTRRPKREDKYHDGWRSALHGVYEDNLLDQIQPPVTYQWREADVRGGKIREALEKAKELNALALEDYDDLDRDPN